MTFKPGDKVIYDPAPFEGEKAEGVVTSADKWGHVSVKVAPCESYPRGLSVGGSIRLTRLFEYEQLVIEMPEDEYYGSSTEIYRDKRTGLAVLDKQAYETWITENGL